MRLLSLATALACICLPVMAQDVGKSIDVGGWVVRRVQGEGTQQSCVAATLADDKSGVGFGGTNGMQAFLMLIDPKGSLTPGKEYPLTYKVDKGKASKVTASAVNPTMLIANLGTLDDVGPFYTAVEGGDDIHLETADSEYDYSLTGSKNALAALANCIKASLGN